MKKAVFILLLFSLFACKKSLLTCDFSGEKVTRQIDLSTFETVEVNPMIRLFINDANHNKMTITADKEIIDDVTYKIENGKLILTNKKNCPIQNSGAIAEIHLQAIDIKNIIANTDLDISSDNTLKFNTLNLICENNNVGTNNVADFTLDVNIDNMSVFANGSSVFKITGKTRKLFVGFYGVNPVFKGKNLEADTIKVFQRSSGDMHLYPLQQITGDLYGYGNIYLYNRPPVVNITTHYAGQIFFVN